MGWCSGICIGLLACTDDRVDSTVVTGDVPIELSGIAPDAISARATRAPGQNESNLYLKAVVEGTGATYITQTRINCPSGLSETDPRDMQFVSGSYYYPLGQQPIRFFAYSGQESGGFMTLTAGSTPNQDALLSNYGKREDGTSSDPGDGTLGSSDNPAALLYFRHVMTQLTVNVEIDSTEKPDTVTKLPATVKFTMDDIPYIGKYAIDAIAPDPSDEASADKAVNTTGNYTVQLGTNYLVPNGASLVGKKLKTLIIDNFEATQDDLDGYEIEVSPDNAISTNMAMLPGYAYTLTFLVRRLKVVGIKLEKVNWKVEEIDQDGVTYVPEYLTLDLDKYSNTGADTITKTVLFTDDLLQYVGRPEDGGGDNARMQYVTLPAAGKVDSIQLYTKNGLLIATRVQTSVYNGTTLSLPLSAAGMLPVDNSLPYNPTTNPYAVTNPHQFVNVAKAPGDSYRQLINIDMDALVAEVDQTVPSINEFTGHYDGQDYWVSNVRISGPGMIRVNKGTLENVRLESGYIDANGQSVAGSLCGTNEGTLLACVNEARIINASGTVGGICGVNASAGWIVACVNMGNIPVGSTIGGICGDNRNTAAGAIVSSFSTGMLNRNATTLGGICGTATASSNEVLNTCFWLVGTVGRGIGTSEVAVGSNNTVGMTDVSDVSPERLRNETSATETSADGILTLLNNALAVSPVPEAANYRFVLNQILTASVWPIPLKQ